MEWYKGLDKKKTGGRVRILKAKLWRAIRQQCLSCVSNSDKEVALCTSPKCSLYLYRFGRPLEIGDPVYLSGTGNQYQKSGKIVVFKEGKGFEDAKKG